MIEAPEALTRLREGNLRFASGVCGVAAGFCSDRRALALAHQEPFAVILGCSDSRVPAEIVFDRGVGELFVARVAGNIVTPSLTGSIEFAAARFGTRLVVVLGHSHCGAVKATLEHLQGPGAHPSPNIARIIERVRPSVEDLLSTASGGDPDALLKRAVRSNIRASVAQLKQGSKLLAELMENDGLMIVPAEYSLETGLVDFFDGPGVDRGPSAE